LESSYENQIASSQSIAIDFSFDVYSRRHDQFSSELLPATTGFVFGEAFGVGWWSNRI